MKLVLLCDDQPNQRALACKIAGISSIQSIVTVTAGKQKAHSKKRGAVARLAELGARSARALVAFPLRKAWFEMLHRYQEAYPRFPEVRRLETDDVNSTQVIARIRSIRPDLVVVSGTNLLREPLISTISESGKLLNLHTGISPYIKGGPNCTNWCLAIGRFDLIGNTIMWLDAGIDSGNLVATERTRLTGEENLTELHVAVMEHAHDLYVRSIQSFMMGEDLPNVSQDSIARGRLFLTRHWTVHQAARAVGKFYLHYRHRACAPVREPLRLVSLTHGVLESS